MKYTENLKRGTVIQNKLHPDWGTWIVEGYSKIIEDGHPNSFYEINGESGRRILNLHELRDWKVVKTVRKTIVGGFKKIDGEMYTHWGTVPVHSDNYLNASEKAERIRKNVKTKVRLVDLPSTPKGKYKGLFILSKDYEKARQYVMSDRTFFSPKNR